MRLHSYVAEAFVWLGAAIKLQAYEDQSAELAERAAAERFRLCGEELVRDRFAVCTCGDHDLHDFGEGDVEWR